MRACEFNVAVQYLQPEQHLGVGYRYLRFPRNSS
jgi:hypothetical protein